VTPGFILLAAALQAAPGDSARVHDVATGIVRADNARDIKAVLEFYSDSAMLLPQSEPPVTGRRAIHARYEALFKSYNPAIEGEIDEIRVEGGQAWVRGRNGGWLRGIGGPDRALHDVYLMLLVREADAWRIHRLMWSSVTPFPVQIRSSADGTLQPSFLSLPDSLDPARPTALAVLLHTWSFDYTQRHPSIEAGARARGWVLLAPNFRGRNDHPEACGSRLAEQDILDAVQWVRDHYPVDPKRIYVLGLSGGGHMTMLMAGKHPGLWAAASAWVGLSDVAAWYPDRARDSDGAMMRRCFGGAPSASDSVAAEYRARSPITWLDRAAALPIDIAAGRDDPEVPMAQSVRAFNVLAVAAGGVPVTEAELAELARPGGMLLKPGVADTSADPTWGRKILLRRHAGPSRLTIFEGEHTWMPRAVLEWLDRHVKP
jgi:uncharacterized protein (TIGR02246 family)